MLQIVFHDDKCDDTNISRDEGYVWRKAVKHFLESMENLTFFQMFYLQANNCLNTFKWAATSDINCPYFSIIATKSVITETCCQCETYFRAIHLHWDKVTNLNIVSTSLLCEHSSNWWARKIHNSNKTKNCVWHLPSDRDIHFRSDASKTLTHSFYNL